VNAKLNLRNLSKSEALQDGCLALIAAIRVTVPFVREVEIEEREVAEWITWRSLKLKIRVGWWRSWLYREDIIMIVHRLCHEHQPEKTRVLIEVCA
jgi:hypothetical protein